MNIYRLYRILSFLTFGKLQNTFKLKYKKLKSKSKEQKKINAIIKKNKEEWNKNNNQLIIIGKDKNQTISYYYKNLNITFLGKNARVIIHESCTFGEANFFIHSNCSININKNATANQRLLINCIDNSSITIGDDCMFS